ncbi:MAG: GGDEF and EAL domain-containing protein, partial [Rhizobiales bacterium]|nr:GGDEF and EAL domain-containing protein [Hyphomicrobiales bacterium]
MVYDWSIADDSIRWGANVLDVLRVSEIGRIATGRAFSGLLDAENLTSRHDAVMNGTEVDAGEGVPYQVQYSLLAGGDSRVRLWIEDMGRWYAGPDGRPLRAHGVLRVINDRHEREQRLAFLSRFDELTGYFNRSHLIATLGDALGLAARTRRPIAFMVVAIDNFGAINGAYGFEVADRIFAAVAHRIKAELREGDAIGRFTGNKLGLILMNCEERDMVAAAERFHAAVRNEVITTEAGSVALTVGIGGVALPRYGRTPVEAMARAQEALHLARQRGSGHFVAHAHSPEIQAERAHNLVLSRELVAALNEKRLRLAFQPVLDTASRRPVFHEVLVRLEDAEGGIAADSEFIAVAERLGLVRLIDYRVLDLALEALAAAPAHHLSVNVSAGTIGDSEWLARLSGAISGKPDLASRLIVEITETAMIAHVEEAARFVALLHDLGCRIAIDDFGAGFSSFRHLRDLGVDIVKIAGAFVENLPRSRDDQVFVRALVDIARNLGMTTVAEWVADEETIAMLRGIGVDMLQAR